MACLSKWRNIDRKGARNGTPFSFTFSVWKGYELVENGFSEKEHQVNQSISKAN
jgi:hypothetical protein